MRRVDKHKGLLALLILLLIEAILILLKIRLYLAAIAAGLDNMRTTRAPALPDYPSVILWPPRRDG